MFRKKWDRYLQAVRDQRAGDDPASGPASPAPRLGKTPPARAALRALRSAGGLLESAVWLGMNLVLVIAVVLAAAAAGAKLPPWLTSLVNLIQNVVTRAAAALGLGQ